MGNHRITLLSETFQRFAKEECHNSSVLYEQLSLAIAKDTELLTLAAQARMGERVPNLFFAAVHFLLLKGKKHPVSRFYTSLSGRPETSEEPYPKFRSFCLEHKDDIANLIASRWVQTNEVRRCACLLPIFFVVSRESGGRPLYLMEIGSAAGLLVQWNRYAYRYGTETYGEHSSPVELECSLRGDMPPPIFKVLPKVSGLIGIDINPIDLRDPDSRLWLRALIWPEHVERARLLEQAILVAQTYPPHLIAGDAVKVLPDILPSIPPNSALCILLVWTSLLQKSRDQLSSLLDAYAQKRDFYLVSTTAQHGNSVVMQLTSYIKGTKTIKNLVRCDAHGSWLEWLGEC